MYKILLIILILVLSFLYILYATQNKKIQGGAEDFTEIRESCKSELNLLNTLAKKIQEKYKKQENLPKEYSDLTSLSYFENNIAKLGCHHGQRKLLLGELEFYTMYDHELVIYSGSAPAEHAPFILDKFPKAKHLYIDPNYHSLEIPYVYVYQNSAVILQENYNIFQKNMDRPKYKKINKQLLNAKFWKSKKTVDVMDAYRKISNPGMQEFQKHSASLISDIMKAKERVFIIQDYLTPDLCDVLAKSLQASKVKKYIYVSDIRTNMFDNFPRDADYIWNDAIQMLAIKKLNPNASMLKFHPPYFDKSDNTMQMIKNSDKYAYMKSTIMQLKKYKIDVFENYKKGIYEYIKPSHIRLQAWAPKSSSEVRLIIEPTNEIQDFDHVEWDNKFMWFKMMRNNMYFPHHKKYSSEPYTTEYGWRSYNYDGCYDCAREIDILENYVKKNIIKTQVLTMKKDIDNIQLYPTTGKCALHGFSQKLTPQRFWFAHGKNIYEYNADNKDLRLVVANKKQIAPIYRGSLQVSEHRVQKLINQLL